jgi:hypothetical protein
MEFIAIDDETVEGAFHAPNSGKTVGAERLYRLNNVRLMVRKSQPTSSSHIRPAPNRIHCKKYPPC